MKTILFICLHGSKLHRGSAFLVSSYTEGIELVKKEYEPDTPLISEKIGFDKNYVIYANYTDPNNLLYCYFAIKIN